jgi:hypothetical protein
MKSKIILFILLLSMMVSCASATDYYVSPTGNDSHTGTSIGTAWATPSHAATQALAGDTVYLIGGTYSDTPVSFSNSGTVGNPIVFVAYNGTPLLQGDVGKKTSDDYIGINLNGMSYITITGLEISNYYYGVYNKNINGYQSNIINNNTIHDCYGCVVLNGYTQNSIISNNSLYNSTWNMLGLYGTSPTLSNISLSTNNCTIYNNTLYGNIGHSAIDIFGEQQHITISNNTIEGNQIYYHTTDSVAKGPLEHSTISNNTISNSSYSSIKLLCNDSTISNNYIINSDDEAIILYVATYGGKSFYSYNNIINNNYVNGASVGIRVYGYNTTGRNNTLYADGEYGFTVGNATVIDEVESAYRISRDGNPGSVYVNYTTGDVTSNTRSAAVVYYPTGSSFDAGTLYNDITRYNITILPDSGYIHSVSAVSLGDTCAFSARSSSDSLNTTITAKMPGGSTEYKITVDGSTIDTATSASDGWISFEIPLDTASQYVKIEENVATAINRQVSTSSDDSYETGAAYFSLTTTTLVAKSYTDNTNSGYICSGMRFQNITIPAAATITSAYITGYVESNTYDNANMKIYGNDVDDAATYSTGAKVISRNRTTAYTSWVADGVSTGWANSPDLSTVVQEIIDREGWASGNDISLMMIANTDTGKELRVTSYDGNHTRAPKLYISYSLPEPLGITNYYPSSSSPTVGIDDQEVSFNATSNMISDWSWKQNGTEISNDTGTYTNITWSIPETTGVYNITTIATNETESVQNVWLVTVADDGIAVNISAFTPSDTTPSAINGSNISFSANLSSSGFYEWVVNDSVVSNGTSTSAAYNYTTSSIGDKNITIRTNNDQQTWILSIAPNDFATISPTDTTPSGTVNTSETFTVTLENPTNVYWYRNGSLNQTNTSVTSCSYFVNSSTNGTFNITAISADDTQTWILTISDASGILGFINVPAVAVIVVIAAGGAVGASVIGKWYRRRKNN